MIQKKIDITIICLIISIFTSCTSFMGFQNIKRPLIEGNGTYLLISKHYEDLEESFIIYKAEFYNYIQMMGLGDTDRLYINKIITENGNSYYSLTHSFLGSNWRFMEEITIKVDDSIFKFIDKQSSKDTLAAGSTVNVQEILNYTLDQKIINKMLNAKIIKIQFYGEPIVLTDKQRIILQSFLSDSTTFIYQRD